ncbi:MAG: DUF1501 domain-containing protein [Planctomycetaceae bacterium]|nr:DUF1501 domain-containing protein [Planctomycetaceae bacterium]
MLTILSESPRLCDLVTRRAMLRAGGLAAIGLLPHSHAHAVAAAPQHQGTAKRCILLFLMGGPPQHSMWDPKPLAPPEVRGDIDSIETSVPGIRIGELLPRTAGLMDKMCLLRAVSTGDNAHSSSGYYMLTGVPHAPMNFENANPGSPNDWPAMSAVVQSLRVDSRGTPAAVRLPHRIFNTDGSVWPGQDSGWLGHAADPWLLNCSPGTPGSSVNRFDLAADVTLDRFGRRKSLLNQIEDRLRELDRGPDIPLYDDLQRQAFDLLDSPKARASCDLTREPDSVRDRYGRTQFGQSVLMARRLIEADVAFVQVNWFRSPDEPTDAPCWDSHTNETRRLKENLVPPFDLAYSALMEDLTERGLLDETLVVCMAEFGRSPRINALAGRDHWGSVFSIALAGGGIHGGAVYGRSDEHAAYPSAGMVQPQDIAATLFHCLGYSPETLIHDAVNRPHPISRGHVIAAIL